MTDRTAEAFAALEERERELDYRRARLDAENARRVGAPLPVDRLMWEAGIAEGRRQAAADILRDAAQLQAEADATTDPEHHRQLIDEIEGLWTAARVADEATWQAAHNEAQAGSAT